MELAKILIVEDDLSFANLIQHQLEMLHFDSNDVLIVTSLSDAKLAREEFLPDVVLLDLGISDSNGINTYEAIHKMYKFASIIILSGLNDQALALEIVSKGAQDYLLKTEINAQLLDKTIRYSMLRRSFRLSIFNSEQKYKDVFNRSPFPVLRLVGKSLIIALANPAALSLYQVTKEEIIGKSIYCFNYFKDQKIEI